MAKMVWVAVGAAGGIYAYRKSTAAWEQVRGNGFVGGAQVATTAAASLLGQVRPAVGQNSDSARSAIVRRPNAQSVATSPEPTYAAAEPAYTPTPPGLRVGRFRITRVDGT